MESSNPNNFTNDILKDMKDMFLIKTLREKERVIQEMKLKDERMRQRKARGKEVKGGYEEY